MTTIGYTPPQNGEERFATRVGTEESIRQKVASMGFQLKTANDQDAKSWPKAPRTGRLFKIVQATENGEAIRYCGSAEQIAERLGIIAPGTRLV